MSNVLPQEVVRTNWRAQRARFVAAFSLSVILIAAASSLALLPTYLTLRMGDEIAEPGVENKNTDRAALASAQAMVSLFAPILTATSSPAEAVAAAIAARPSGIVVEHITYTKGTPSSLVLVGEGTGRTAINAYRVALSGDPRFSSVSVPVGDLLGTADGRFSITVTGSF